MARGVKRSKKSKSKSKGKGSGSGESSSAAAAAAAGPTKVWRPGVDAIEEGEELQFDPEAYNYLRGFNVGWPCLSFDIVRDSLGLVRSEFPHTLYGVTGTQAERRKWNYIGIFKLSNIAGKNREVIPASSPDDDDDDDAMDSDDDDSDDEDESKEPVLQLKRVAHEGCVNRIRSMTQKPHICVTWADIGHVQVWDFTGLLNSLAESETAEPTEDSIIHTQSPVMSFGGHKDEGYAIDWSPVVTGRLVSGDCSSSIYLWEPTSDTWNVDKTPFLGHVASVEDLQWSPVEADIFASCSADGTVAIWDVRVRKQPVVSLKAHNADVNVISWSRLASCMIASGSDDGSISIHDLRLIKEGDSLQSHFEYHKQPITSIEWSPHEASTFAASSADHQLTIWDLALERDEEEEAEFQAKMKEQALAPEDLPQHLLFVHQGQKDLKELHWHSQIPGMIMSTAADGFNVLMPSNIDTTIPPASG